MKLKKDKDGYYNLSLNKNSISKSYRVSRLVAIAFIPNPDNLPQVLHKNNIVTDNHVDNLKWGTGDTNTKEAARDGLMTRGITHHFAKFTENQILEIRENYKKIQNYVSIAKLYNVSANTIHCIIKRKSWKHV